jgi:glucan endo-1,3-alpha-glucosidase
MSAIKNSHPDWVEIITWNDFIEGSYVSPIDDPNKYAGANFLNASGIPLNTQGYFHSHAAATALLSYFIQWYKTGHQPAIARDAVYYFYRTQLKDVDAGTPPVAHKFGPVKDVIYITANLTAPAELTVTTGGHAKVLRLPAGSTDVETPLSEGNPPIFELMRNGRLLGKSTATDPVLTAPKFNNFYYSTGELTVP